MRLYLLAISFLLFIGNNVLYHFGIIPTSLMTTILPSAYLLCFILLKNKLRPLGEKEKSNKEEFILCGIVAFLFFMQVAMKASGFVGGIINMLLLPIGFSYLYPKDNDALNAKIRKLIISFYCVDSLWSIIERILGKNIFPFTG